MKHKLTFAAVSILASGTIGGLALTTAYASTGSSQFPTALHASISPAAHATTLGANAQQLVGNQSASDTATSSESDSNAGVNVGANVQQQVGGQNGPDTTASGTSEESSSSNGTADTGPNIQSGAQVGPNDQVGSDTSNQ